MTERLGKWLSGLIDDRALTRAEVADRAGIDASNLSKILAGKWVPRSLTRKKIATALGMPFHEFERGWQDDPDQSDSPAVRAGPPDDETSQRFVQAQGSEMLVEGDSMEPYLSSGDRLILRAAAWGEQPSPGEAVVVYIEGKGQALYCWGPLPNGRVRLFKHNPAHAKETIEIDPASILRLLRVVRVVRKDRA